MSDEWKQPLANASVSVTHHAPSLLTSLQRYPHSSLVTHYSSLITHHSSLITHHSSLITLLSSFRLHPAPRAGLRSRRESFRPPGGGVRGSLRVVGGARRRRGAGPSRCRRRRAKTAGRSAARRARRRAAHARAARRSPPEAPRRPPRPRRPAPPPR